MRKIMAFFLAIFLTIFIVPTVLVPAFKYLDNTKGEPDAIGVGNFSDSFDITVYLKEEDKVISVDFEEYLVGVLAGEMPPTYHIEALKAQAVAARSYILSKAADTISGTYIKEHKGAMVCNDFNHCKAWKNIENAKKTWDIRFADEYEAKLKMAVNETKGEYMLYDNKVVKAYFFAMSSGRTENVEDVWNVSIPYLRSVSSDWDKEADGFKSTSSYPKDLFIQKINKINEKVEINDLKEDIKITKRSDGGGVKEIKIGKEVFDGEDIRECFDLRSTNFEVEISGDKITFLVKGYGHGVGMSQNGANAMANDGKSYKKILKHYYTGVSIVNLYKNF